MTKALSRMQGY